MLPLLSFENTLKHDNPQRDNPELWNYYMEILQFIRHIVFEEKPIDESDIPIFQIITREQFYNYNYNVNYVLDYDVVVDESKDEDDENHDLETEQQDNESNKIVTYHRALIVQLIKSNNKIIVFDRCYNSSKKRDFPTFDLINYDAYDENTIRRLEEPETFKELLKHWMHIERCNYSNWFLQDEMGKITTRFINKYNDEWFDKIEPFLTAANIRRNYIQDESNQFGHRVFEIPEMQNLVRQKGIHKDPYKYLTQDDDS